MWANDCCLSVNASECVYAMGTWASSCVAEHFCADTEAISTHVRSLHNIALIQANGVQPRARALLFLLSRLIQNNYGLPESQSSVYAVTSPVSGRWRLLLTSVTTFYDVIQNRRQYNDVKLLNMATFSPPLQSFNFRRVGDREIEREKWCFVCVVVCFVLFLHCMNYILDFNLKVNTVLGKHQILKVSDDWYLNLNLFIRNGTEDRLTPVG